MHLKLFSTYSQCPVILLHYYTTSAQVRQSRKRKLLRAITSLGGADSLRGQSTPFSILSDAWAMKLEKPLHDANQNRRSSSARSSRWREAKCPLFQDLQITILPEEPVSFQSGELLDEGKRTEAPAA